MLESSNKFNHNYHLNTAIHTEAPAISGGTPPTPEDPKNPNKKRNRNIVLGAVGVVAAGALAATLAVGLGSGNKSQGEQPPKGTETSAPATPNTDKSNSTENGAEVNPGAAELTVESLQFDPNATPEEWAKQYGEGLGKWRMAGANEETGKRSLDSSLTVNQFAAQEAEHNAALFAEAYYGPDWESDPDLSYAVDFDSKQNAASILDYFTTSKDKTRYKWTETVNSTTVLSTNGNETIVEIVSTATNNSADNRAGELSPELLALNGKQSTEDVTFTKSGDHVYVTEFHVK